MKNFMKKHKEKLVLAVVSVAAASAIAAGVDTTFNAILTKITEWAEGSLGKLLALGMLMTSMFMAFVSTNLMGALAALGAALIISNAPTIVTTIFSAGI